MSSGQDLTKCLPTTDLVHGGTFSVSRFIYNGTILSIALSMNDLSYLFIELDMQGKIVHAILFDVPHKHIHINISL